MNELKTKADLQLRHQELHRAFDELLGCYIGSRRTASITDMIQLLMEFSHRQTIGPTSCVGHDQLPEWTPAPENINALPEPIRKYVHDLETNADPAGNIRESICQRENAEALAKRAAAAELLNRELLDACEQALPIVEGYNATLSAAELLRGVIAKARGQ